MSAKIVPCYGFETTVFLSQTRSCRNKYHSLPFSVYFTSQNYVSSVSVLQSQTGALKELEATPGKRYDKRIVIKWWKMVTLVHNPTLILERIEKRIKDAEKINQATIVVSFIYTMFRLRTCL